mgnify:CR=1 FL=1
MLVVWSCMYSFVMICCKKTSKNVRIKGALFSAPSLILRVKPLLTPL